MNSCCILRNNCFFVLKAHQFEYENKALEVLRLEGEKCKEIQDRCIDEIYQIVKQLDLEDYKRLIVEYLDSHKISPKVEKF